MRLLNYPNLGGGGGGGGGGGEVGRVLGEVTGRLSLPPPPHYCWFNFNNSETVTAVIPWH